MPSEVLQQRASRHASDQVSHPLGDQASERTPQSQNGRENNTLSPAAAYARQSAELFAPVFEAMQQVEAKLRSSDSKLFAPLADAFVTLIGAGGKRLRPALALLAWGMTQPADAPLGPTPQIAALAASVEMLHTSTLVHDDVIDGALLRRGAPTLNASWTGGSTVMAGNYLFGTAASFAAETESMRVIHIFSDTLRVIVDGELHQLLDRYNYSQPIDHYLQRIYAKTASLFCAATEGGAVLAGMDEGQIAALRSYGYNLGMAFQIVDDILDFTSDADSLGKPSGSDLNQGTLTLPFFNFVETLADRDALVERLEAARDRADEGEVQVWRDLVREVVVTLNTTDAANRARVEAQRYLDLARADLAPFAETPAKRSLLALCDFVLARKH